MASAPVTQQSHKDYLSRHREIAFKLAVLESRRASLAAQETLQQARRNALGDRVRAGLVNEVPSLDGLLEAQLTDVFIEVASAGSTDIIGIHTNAQAAIKRAEASSVDNVPTAFELQPE